MNKMMRLKDVCARLSVSKSHVRRLVKDSNFPQPIKLGPRASAWPEAEVDSWVSRRIEESRRRDAESAPEEPISREADQDDDHG